MKRTVLMWAGVIALAVCLGGQALGGVSELTLRGRLAPTVEAGGWLIVTGGREKYLILNARKFQSESWFREGAQVVAEGETREDAVTIYMEGTPFEARTMRAQPRGNSEGDAGSGDGGGGEPQQPVTSTERERGLSLTRVTVVGDAVVESRPDTAVLSLAVVTQNASASEAQAENASRAEAVVRAVRAAAGQGAEVETGGYSLQPQYVYKENQPPTITGYIARNSVTVTMSDLTKVGAVIDAASRAGANSVDSLSFILRRDGAARKQALGDATREAIGKAQTIAQVLGGRLVRIVAVEESGAVVRPPVPLPYETRVMPTDAAQSTPIEVGSLDIRAQVQLVAEIETRQ